MKSLTKLRSIGLCALAFWGMMTSGLIAFLPQFLFGSNLLTTILMAGLYIFLYYLFAKWLSRRLGMNLIQFRMTLAKPSQFWIATAIFLPLTVLLVLYLLGGKVVLTDDVATTIFMGAIAAPIVEEMCFRGIMMQLLEQAFSRKVAILGPSVFFGLVHLLNGAVSPLTALQLLIAGTLVGSLFSLATLQTGSILSSILVHSLWNLFTSIFLFDNQSSLFGGEYGVDVSPIASLAYLVVILLSMIAHRKKAS
ncbi:type II CAAX endopeptidase family protein [Streptococcus suis]|uniref:CPBP family intramembrane glutamic endopeptidase n=1 Tax=Streptococcus suis TaxID=1307 RepID=UPI0038BC2272